MPDVFTKRKRSEVMARIRGRGNKETDLALARLLRDSESSEVEFVPGDAKVFDNVGDDATRDIARMPGKGDEPVGTKRIGVVPVTAGAAQMLAPNFAQPPLQLAAVVRGIFPHGSGGEDEFVAKGGGDGTPGFQQRFQMNFGGLLKAEKSFAPVASVRVASRQQGGLGNPHAVFILPDLDSCEWNNHGAETLTRDAVGVKRAFDA